MVKIKYSIHYFFAYFVPGAVMLLAVISSIDPTITKIVNLSELLENIKLGNGLIAILFAYLIGFIIDAITYPLYRLRFYKCLNNPYYSDLKEPNLIQKQALLQHWSINNYNYLIRWKALKDMSQHLCLPALAIVSMAIVKAVKVYSSNYCFQWIVLATVALVSCLILQYTAKRLDDKFYKDIGYVAELL